MNKPISETAGKVSDEIALPACFEPINHFVKLALKPQIQYDFFLCLCENIIPLLQTIPLLGDVRAGWADARSQHEEKVNTAIENAKRQVALDYKNLKHIVEEEKIEITDSVAQCFLKIHRLLNNEDPYYTPPEWEVAYDHLCEIGSLLVNQGYGKLIEKYVKIGERLEYSVDDEGNFITTKHLVVDRFHFAPAVEQARHLRAIWDWKRLDPTWTLWTRLCDAAWAWNEDPIVFSKEKMRNATPLLRRKTMNLLDQQHRLSEMQNIKDQRPDKNGYYFTVIRFQNYLRVIINEIATVIGSNLSELYTNTITPFMFQLHLEESGNDRLWLTVQWKEEGVKEAYCLRKFQEESESHLFAREMMKHSSGGKIATEILSSAKLIDRCNLNNVLKNLFFGKCSVNNAPFRGTKVSGKSVQGEELKKLLTYLQKAHQRGGTPSAPISILAKT